MPSAPHEVMVAVLREHPAWLDGLLAARGRPPLARGLAVADSAVRFAPPAEVRADLVLAAGAEGPWVLVEVQLELDAVKQRKWLLAAAVLFDARGTMGDRVVITAQPHVAQWATTVARDTGPLGTQLGLVPVVVLLSGAQAAGLLDETHPERAFFAAWAMHERHGDEAQRVVRRALELTARLPTPLRAAQIRAILGVLSERMLEYLREVIMNPQTIPEPPGVRALREELEARGEARWTVAGEARALLGILAAREIAVDESTRARIVACADLAQLDRWIARAAVAASLADVFAER